MIRRLVRPRVVLALAVAAAAVVLLAPGGDPYRVRAEFDDAGGLRKNSDVRIDGVPVGKVASLEVNGDDVAVATLELEDAAGPIGAGARADVRSANVLGEKYVDLQVGDADRPAPSGSRIPPDRTDAPVELDDVLNVLDPDTRTLLSVMVNEAGLALSGRGAAFGQMLSELPPALDEAERMIGGFALDNRALGRLVVESDRLLASVGRERTALGRLIEHAEGALQTTASRHAGLSETVRQAPSAIAQLRSSLASLDGTATALGPAARALRDAAPQLTAFLSGLPGFTDAAEPTLRAASQAAPSLIRLGRGATPVLRRLRPAAGELATFGAAFDPGTSTLDAMMDDTLGVLEGWARSIQVRDAAGHMFRNQASLNLESFLALGDRYLRPKPKAKRNSSRARQAPAPARPESAPQRESRPEARRPVDESAPARPLGDLETGELGVEAGEVEQLLDFLLKP